MATLDLTENPNRIIIPIGVANADNAGQIGYASWQGGNIVRIVMATNTITTITLRYVRIASLS